MSRKSKKNKNIYKKMLENNKVLALRNKYKTQLPKGVVHYSTLHSLSFDYMFDLELTRLYKEYV